jgi:phosphatidylcholine synthase
MLLATLIDATDGTLARAVRIKQTLPGFDGRRLDDLVDFLLYTCLPLLLLYRAAVLPPAYEWLLVAALLASAYGFSQADIKTADGAFLGFPSYWNIVAFYCYAVPLDGLFAVGIVAALSLLTFVPSKYPYPTQPGMVNRVMLLLGAVWGLGVAWTMFQSWSPEPPHATVLVSIAYPVLYVGYSWGHSLYRVATRFA